MHKELAAEQPLEIVSTFLGAHVVPPEFRGKPNGAEKYMALLIDKVMPEVASQKLAEFCDVFCDRGAFTRRQAKTILEAGKRFNLTPRLHAEQLTRTGAAQLAVELDAASCDHLEQVNRSDIRALGQSKTAATKVRPQKRAFLAATFSGSRWMISFSCADSDNCGSV